MSEDVLLGKLKKLQEEVGNAVKLVAAEGPNKLRVDDLYEANKPTMSPGLVAQVESHSSRSLIEYRGGKAYMALNVNAKGDEEDAVAKVVLTLEGLAAEGKIHGALLRLSAIDLLARSPSDPKRAVMSMVMVTPETYADYTQGGLDVT